MRQNDRVKLRHEIKVTIHGVTIPEGAEGVIVAKIAGQRVEHLRGGLRQVRHGHLRQDRPRHRPRRVSRQAPEMQSAELFNKLHT